MLVEQLHYLPLPTISGDNEDMAFKLEDMVISFYDVLPEHIFIDTETHTDFKPLSDYEHEYIDKTLEAGFVASMVLPPKKRLTIALLPFAGICSTRRANWARERPTIAIMPGDTSPVGELRASMPNSDHARRLHRIWRQTNAAPRTAPPSPWRPTFTTDPPLKW